VDCRIGLRRQRVYKTGHARRRVNPFCPYRPCLVRVH
jgi:hypothetical protein